MQRYRLHQDRAVKIHLTCNKYDLSDRINTSCVSDPSWHYTVNSRMHLDRGTVGTVSNAFLIYSTVDTF